LIGVGYRLATTAKLIDVGLLVRQAAPPGRLTQCDAAAASDRFAHGQAQQHGLAFNADRRAACLTDC
jgi:DNA-binding IscR family transcriptional regulator